MSEEIKVTNITVKLGEKEVRLTMAEARKLQKVLDNVLGKPKDDPQPYPNTIFVPYCPTCPPCQPYRRWGDYWGNTSTGEPIDNNTVICSLSGSPD